MKLTRQVRRRILELRIFPDPIAGTRSPEQIGRIVGVSGAAVRKVLRVAGDRAIRELPIERVVELLDSEDRNDGPAL